VESGGGKRGTRDDQIPLPMLRRNHGNHSHNAFILKARFSENLTHMGLKHDRI
jgi:hypothetical protein